MLLLLRPIYGILSQNNTEYGAKLMMFPIAVVISMPPCHDLLTSSY